MPGPITAADEAVLARRGFLRGGALLAAAAGGAVAASAAAAVPAQADASDVLAVSLGIPPERLLDTRTADGRALIVDSSPSAFDSKHRMKNNAWIDVAVFPTGQDIELLSAFVNLGSRESTKKGTLVVTEPVDDEPKAFTLHYGKAAEVSNSAIVGVGLSDDESVYTVRIFAGSVTHVILDLTGVSAFLPLGSDARATARTSSRASLTRVVKAARSLRR
jgi:hypothetical protein